MVVVVVEVDEVEVLNGEVDEQVEAVDTPPAEAAVHGEEDEEVEEAEA